MLGKVLEEIKNLLREAGVDSTEDFSVPPDPSMGDIAFPCFGIAKEQKKNPAEVAKEIELRIKNYELRIVSAVKAFGPYVNFYLNTGELARLVIEEVKEKAEEYGNNDDGNGRKVMIEYPSQNTHKEFHIGHLRNICIGNTLTRLYDKSGYKISLVNYVNDFGAHVAKCLWGVITLRRGKEPEDNKLKWLGEVYAEAGNYLAEHPEKKDEVEDLQNKFEAHDPSIWPLFSRTRDWCLEGFEKIYREMGISYERVFYESELKERGQQIVDELLAKKIAQVGERGAIIVDLTEYGLDIALLRKGNGAGLYITSDLALAEQKFSAPDIDESINITGDEQNFYFKQLFKILELNGFRRKLTHIGYGLVNLPEGKMSSRQGRVILYDDLREQVRAHLTTESAERHPDWNREKLADITDTLTMAVLKFTMQKHEANKVIVFNFAEEVSFEGYSAPYLLYAVARINSLIRKSELKISHSKIKYELLKESEEKQLLILIANYPEVIKKALAQYNPSVVAKFCFDLAQKFSEFYNKHSVLNAENEELTAARVALCMAAKNTLVNALGVLSIETVDEM
ncbi:MAG: arginine--tRNA ligase [Patescibacteria group bacterium]